MFIGRSLCGIAIITVAFFALGCSASPDTYLLTGTVTLDGEPIPEGDLDFLAPQEGLGPVASAEIKDGKYKVYLRKGTWRVQVNASREGKIKNPHTNLPERESYIPSRYNTQSTLTVEVLPTKENRHDLTLQTR